MNEICDIFLICICLGAWTFVIVGCCMLSSIITQEQERIERENRTS